MSQMIAAANWFFWVSFRCNNMASFSWKSVWAENNKVINNNNNNNDDDDDDDDDQKNN